MTYTFGVTDDEYEYMTLYDYEEAMRLVADEGWDLVAAEFMLSLYHLRKPKSPKAQDKACSNCYRASDQPPPCTCSDRDLLHQGCTCEHARWKAKNQPRKEPGQ